MKKNRVLIKGAGDLASGVALRLHRAGYLVAMTDLAEPTAIRWTVSFCPAILQGTAMVEDVRGRLAKGEADALAAWAATALDVEVLRKCFGAFLIIVGTMELFGKARE